MSEKVQSSLKGKSSDAEPNSPSNSATCCVPAHGATDCPDPANYVIAQGDESDFSIYLEEDDVDGELLEESSPSDTTAIADASSGGDESDVSGSDLTDSQEDDTDERDEDEIEDLDVDPEEDTGTKFGQLRGRNS